MREISPDDCRPKGGSNGDGVEHHDVLLKGGLMQCTKDRYQSRSDKEESK